MKTLIILFIATLFFFSCGQTQTKNENAVAKTIKTKEYFPDDKATRVSEMTVDSVLNGLTVWYDSAGVKSSEVNYLNGKLNGICKLFFENGNLLGEKEFKNDSLIKEKYYYSDGRLKLINPIDVSKLGKMKVIIANGERNYLIKNKKEKVTIKDDGLPGANQEVIVKNAMSIKHLENDCEYEITQKKNNVSKVRILLKANWYLNSIKYDAPVDSLEIEVK
jgi:hypothetical protein